MRLIRCSILLSAMVVIATVVAACGGDEEEPTPGVVSPPAAATPAPTATPFATVPEPVVVTGQGIPGTGLPGSEEAMLYTVESGDTISGIAERFGVSADVIRSANEIEDDQIFIGQELTIPRSGGTPAGTPGAGGEDGDDDSPTPPPPGDGTTYTVVEGDTAFGIALEFDTTVEALAAANGMTEEEITDLQIGQVINLPTPE